MPDIVVQSETSRIARHVKTCVLHQSQELTGQFQIVKYSTLLYDDGSEVRYNSAAVSRLGSTANNSAVMNFCGP